MFQLVLIILLGATSFGQEPSLNLCNPSITQLTAFALEGVIPIEWESFNLFNPSTIRIDYKIGVDVTAYQIAVVENTGLYLWDTQGLGFSNEEEYRIQITSVETFLYSSSDIVLFQIPTRAINPWGDEISWTPNGDAEPSPLNALWSTFSAQYLYYSSELGVTAETNVSLTSIELKVSEAPAQDDIFVDFLVGYALVPSSKTVMNESFEAVTTLRTADNKLLPSTLEADQFPDEEWIEFLFSPPIHLSTDYNLQIAVSYVASQDVRKGGSYTVDVGENRGFRDLSYGESDVLKTLTTELLVLRFNTVGSRTVITDPTECGSFVIDTVSPDSQWVRLAGSDDLLQNCLSLAYPDCRAAATLEKYNGIFYQFGGKTISSTGLMYFNDIWMFDQTSWTEIDTEAAPMSCGAIPAPRSEHSSVLWGNFLVIYGGRDDSTVFPDVWTYDLATNDSCPWVQQSTSGTAPVGRYGHKAVVAGTGMVQMFVFGGASSSSTFTDELWALDLNGMSWTQLDGAYNAATLTCSTSRCLHGHSLVQYNGTLVVFGGEAFLADIAAPAVTPPPQGSLAPTPVPVPPTSPVPGYTAEHDYFDVECIDGMRIDIECGALGTVSNYCGNSGCQYSQSTEQMRLFCQGATDCRERIQSNDFGYNDCCQLCNEWLRYTYRCVQDTCVRISQQESIQLSCDSGYTLDIVWASYGVPTSCGVEGTCHHLSSFAIVKTICQGLRSCSITTPETLFSPNPCSGYDKYLMLQYTCQFGEQGSGCHSAVEGGHLDLACGDGLVVVSVSFASYGSPTGCTQVNDLCHSPESSNIIEALCLDENSCTISATNDVFGDPGDNCPAQKELWVNIMCGAPRSPYHHTNSILVWDIEGGFWNIPAARCDSGDTHPKCRRGHSAVMNGDTMLVFGGGILDRESSVEKVANDVWEIDLSAGNTDVWNSGIAEFCADLEGPSCSLQSTSTSFEGVFVVSGGLNIRPGSTTYLNTVWGYRKRPALGDNGPQTYPTQGGVLHVVGDHFIDLSSSLVVTASNEFMDVNLSITSTTRNEIYLVIPEGVGRDLEVLVTVYSLVAWDSDPTVLYSYEPPVIHDVTFDTNQISVEGGAGMSITGINFGPLGSQTIRMGESYCSDMTYISHEEISCIIPAGTGAGLEITVEVGGQISNPGPVQLSYDPPTISSVNYTADPPSINTNQTLLTIYGTNFDAIAARVLVGGKECGQINEISTQELQCTIPDGAGADLDVEVDIGGQSAVLPGVFTYQAPIVDGLLYPKVPTSGGVTLSIAGRNFGSDSPFIDKVLVAGKPCSNPFLRDLASECEGVPNSENSTDCILCDIPPGAGIGLTVTVQIRGGLSQPSDMTLEYDLPEINSLSDGLKNTFGDNPLTIFGLNFGPDDDPSIVVEAFVDGSPCLSVDVLPSQSQEEILCMTPEGSGKDLPVRVVVAGQEATLTGTNSFTYDSPVVWPANPALEYLTDGGQTFQIEGYNFGQPGDSIDIWIGHTHCPKPSTGCIRCTNVTRNGEVLECTIPEGIGNQFARVIVDGLENDNQSPVPLNYRLAEVASIQFPETPSTGGTNLTLLGDNFGPDFADIHVFVGEFECPLIPGRTHRRIDCTIPPGTGIKDIILHVDEQVVVSPAESNYALPQIVFPIEYGSDPAPHTDGSREDSPGAGDGGADIIIKGTNFGISTDPGLVRVFVGPRASENVNRFNETYIIAKLPYGGGMDLVISVDINGQTAEANEIFSYPPPIVNYSNADSYPTRGFFFLSIFGEEFNRFEIDKSVANRVVTIGNSGPLIPDVCQRDEAGHECLQVNVPPGTGCDLDVIVWVDGQSGTPSKFSYDAPSIQELVYNADITTAGGEVLIIRGENFGFAESLLTVRIGKFPCTVSLDRGDPPESPDPEEIDCLIPPGSGKALEIAIQVDLQESSDDIKEQDLLFFYPPPVVESLAYDGSPTTGNSSLLIHGQNFGTGSFKEDYEIQIGFGSCPQEYIQWIYHTELLCEHIPAGLGQNLGVSVVVSAQQSNSLKEFDYEVPLGFNVYLTNGTADTRGGYMLRIVGRNFGVEDPDGIILIGSVPCLSTTWYSDTEMDCEVPPGFGQSRDIVLELDQDEHLLGTFAYGPPLVYNVLYPDAPTSGNIELEIIGDNFGPEEAFPFTVITIGDKTCSDIKVFNHSIITCTVLSGAGRDLQITIDIGDQSTNSDDFEVYFNYDRPKITRFYSIDEDALMGLFSTAGLHELFVLGENFGNNEYTPEIVIGDYNWSCTLISMDCPQPDADLGCFKASNNCTCERTLGPIRCDPTWYQDPDYLLTDCCCRPTNENADQCTVVATPVECIRCYTPEGAGRDLHVKVNIQGQYSLESEQIFSYEPPLVTSIFYEDANTTGGYSLSVYGQNFGPTIATDIQQEITIGGSVCEDVRKLTRNGLRCTTPGGVGKDLVVVLTVEGQSSVAPQSYSYAPPEIEEINIGELENGNTAIAITGWNFGPEEQWDQDPPQAKITLSQNDEIVQCDKTTWESQTEILCDVQQGRTGDVQISVDVAGQSTVVTRALTIEAPVVDAVEFESDSPTLEHITITGSNFGYEDTAIPVVTVAGRSCFNVTRVNATMIQCFPPDGSGIDVDVMVTVEEQTSQASYLSTFTYPSPVINELRYEGDEATTDGGWDLTIGGLNFGIPGSKHSVTLGNFSSPWICEDPHFVEVRGKNGLVCTAPAGYGRNVEVNVEVDGQTSTLLKMDPSAKAHVHYQPPNVTSVSDVPVDTTDRIVIRGSNFGSSDAWKNGQIAVKFAENECSSIDWVDHTELKCVTVPLENGRQYYPLEVTVGGQTSSKYNVFVYYPPLPAGLKETIEVISYISYIFLFAVIILLWIFRGEPQIQAASPKFLYIMLIGGMIAMISVFIAADHHGVQCHLWYWTVLVGYTMLYGSLSLKNYRILRIFNKQLKRVAITDKQLLIYLGVMLFIDFVTLIPLSVVSYCGYPEDTTSLLVFVIVFIYKVAILLAGVFIAFKIRNIQLKEYRERIALSYATYNLVFMVSLLVPLAAVFRRVFAVVYTIRTLGVVVAVMVAVIVVFVPKLFGIYRLYKRGDKIPDPGTTLSDISDDDQSHRGHHRGQGSTKRASARQTAQMTAMSSTQRSSNFALGVTPSFREGGVLQGAT